MLAGEHRRRQHHGGERRGVERALALLRRRLAVERGALVRQPSGAGDQALHRARGELLAVAPTGGARTRQLARRLRAPALLTTFSRLLIDPNRGADDPTLVMRLSDGAIVPGNARLDAAGIAARRRRFWQPYRDAIEDTIEAMRAAGPVPVVLSVHSFTPTWKGVPRPWEVGVLWDSDARLARPLLAALAAVCRVGDNEPYDGALEGDTLDAAVTRRGLPGLLIEVRQDLVATERGAETWAARLADVLAPLLADPGLHAYAFPPSRTGRHRRP